MIKTTVNKWRDITIITQVVIMITLMESVTHLSIGRIRSVVRR